jgi:serine/threonine-protein kinase PpkA
VHNVLLGLLILSALGFSAVQYYASQFAREGRRAPDQPPVGLNVQPALPAAPTAPVAGGATATPHSTEVRRALVWLAQKSLDDYRLTSPPKDNAYYYYSRLQMMDPNDPVVAEGFRQIAEHFAMLAEREIARNNVVQARRYIAIGLQLDPGNASLNQLQSLAKPAPHGFIDVILSLFHTSPVPAPQAPDKAD